MNFRSPKSRIDRTQRRSERLLGDGDHDRRVHAAVVRASLAFWDGYLGGDAEARRWLLDGGVAALLDGEAVVETRRV